MTQRDRLRCACGGWQIVTPTDSPYEFDIKCDTCPEEAWVSWAHRNPPPTFRKTAQQQELFDGTA